MAWHKGNEASRRLETIPGVGFHIASAIVATVPDPSFFRSGASSPPGLGWFSGTTSAAERSGSVTYRTGKPLHPQTSGAWRYDHVALRSGGQGAGGGLGQLTAQRRLPRLSLSPWPTRRAYRLGLAGQGRNLPRSTRRCLTKSGRLIKRNQERVCRYLQVKITYPNRVEPDRTPRQ